MLFTGMSFPRLSAFFVACAALTALYPTTARAHEFWLQPDRYHVTPGTQVGISVHVGQYFKGDSLPYVPDWVAGFDVTGPEGRRAAAAGIGDDPAGRISVEKPATYVVVYQSRPETTRFEPDEFDRYLAEAGLDEVAAARRRGDKGSPVWENYVRCAKTLVDAGGDGPVTKPQGLPLEIIPLSNPYRLSRGAPLTVSVLYGGRPVPGALLHVFSRTHRETPERIRTDANGRASVALHANEEWLLNVIHMVNAGGPGKWMSYWASLTFQLR